MLEIIYQISFVVQLSIFGNRISSAKCTFHEYQPQHDLLQKCPRAIGPINLISIVHRQWMQIWASTRQEEHQRSHLHIKSAQGPDIIQSMLIFERQQRREKSPSTMVEKLPESEEDKRLRRMREVNYISILLSTSQQP